MENELSTLILAVVGTAISLFAMWFPRFNTWYAGLEETVKKLVMLGFCFVASLVMYGLSCFNVWVVVACSTQGVFDLLYAFGVIIVSNQVAHRVLPESRLVRAVKQAGYH